MNWANRLTLSRLVFSIVFVAALSERWPYGYVVALGLFLLAGLTDYVDGQIARRFNMITDFGKLMDPLVDKIMVAAAFICLVELNLLPAWAVIVIVAREFLITGLRLLAATKGQVLAAEKLGKHKTGWQIGTIIWFLVVLAADEIGVPAQDWDWTVWVGNVAVGITVGLTLYSGLAYLWRHRDLIRTA
jgi:CDP-diacylglycerol--glycerol-3-phosphate 3-phosphatidyltransferase